MNLLLIRHGQCGTTSVDDILTPVGEWQAQQIGQRLIDVPITALLSSPLLRALGTAHIIAQRLGSHSIEIWPELREGLFEQYQGYGRAQLRARFPLAIPLHDMQEESQSYKGDTKETMFTRCQHVLKILHERFGQEDTVIVVSRGGMLTYLLHIILQIPAEKPSWFDLEYGSMSYVRFVPSEKQKAYPPLYVEMEVEIRTINDTLHLQNQIEKCRG